MERLLLHRLPDTSPAPAGSNGKPDAMSKRKPEKIRTDFRKNRSSRQRKTDITRSYQMDPTADEDSITKESFDGKGALTRKRTVIGDRADNEASPLAVHPDVDLSACQPGRVIAVHGLNSIVATESGKQYRCATRRLLKTLATDQRHVVVTGDQVLFRTHGNEQGVIERVEPRHSILSRNSRGRQHVLVANIDQLVIITSAAEPTLKPHLIDRILISSEKGRVRPIICINKIDLVNPADLQPLVGIYAQMGYLVLQVSATAGTNIDRLGQWLTGAQSVVTGQSGVGKSSLLNAVEPGLDLRVGRVSEHTQKGKHTTTNARLLPLGKGGYVVDTPGIRQFELWDVEPQEVASFFRDLRSFVHDCHFPNCTHTHEDQCAVKDAVADGYLDTRRYESYCQLFFGE
jgi:ribosome biogenesis GTPase